MERTMKVEAYQLLDVAKNILIQMGIHDCKDVKLTWILKVDNEWRVNFSYTTGIYEKVGAFAVDAETGEIRHSALGRVWK